MQRNSSTPAIIRSLRPLGENNSGVTILTKNQGIQYVTLYGGPKSKLRSLVTQFNTGNIWLYETPEKHQTKITDFQVTNYHPSFGQNLFKMYAASLGAELAIKTRCSGSNEQCYILLKGFYDGMELCDEDQCRLGLIRFLWRYLELMGIQPSSHACAHCGKSFLESQIENESFSYYNNYENSFICSDCNTEATGFKIKTSAVQYLTGITVLTPSQSRQLKIDKIAYEQIKQIVFFLIENSVEQKLNSIETGMGIL